MDRIVNLTGEQKLFAKKLGVSEDFLRLLVMRGLSLEEIPSFLKPSFDDMVSPFTIDGMREASDRVKEAIKNQERILIFGDYDCDGVGAVSILTLYLRDKTDVTYFIPNRFTDGYGMTIDALKGIITKRKPDLVITVDCGITSVKEVDYLTSLGVDVIVTDHHEPQDELPRCIIVDPKVKREGFYDFCGAGVALKLVEAMAGREEIKKYLDVAAISTIADVVPLRKDNRIIAYYGLKAISQNPRKGIKVLMGGGALSSQDVMFKLAPRINAAGRLSSAMKAVDLFVEDDIFILRALADELESDNAKRQAICENLVNEAKAMLKGIDFNNLGVIVLAGKNWESGVLGIAAARLVEEFKFPTILFSDNGEELKGSARSIKAINIFEYLSRFSHLFKSFGGHSQAAGITIPKENFEEFRNSINADILKDVSAEQFMPKFEYDLVLDANKPLLPFAKELQLLEPTGYGNPQPNFLIKGNSFRFERIGLTKHVKCNAPGLEMIGFYRFEHCLGATRGDVEIDINLSVNNFQNRQYAQGIVRAFNTNSVSIPIEESDVINLHQLDHEGDCILDEITTDGVNALLERPFGTAVVCFNQEEYDRLIEINERIAKLPIFVASTFMLNPMNCVIVCPAEGFDFSYFENVVFAGRPLCSGYLADVKDKVVNCYAYGDCSPIKMSIADDAFRAVFREIRKFSSNGERATSQKSLYRAVAPANMTFVEYAVIMRVFSQLGLISLADRGMINVSNQRTELAKSVTYRNVRTNG